MENLVIPQAASRAPAAAAIEAPLRVLVTGADGFIGSVLTPVLLDRGFDVVGLDTGYYRAGLLYHDGKDRPATLTRDVRSLTARDLEGFDAVVHLAELSNDPLCQHDPQKTYAINHLGSVALARAAKEAGVSRFVYASSCSVYGAAGDSTKTEAAEPDPQTAYAHCKVLVERDVQALADDDFSPTFLRNATAFGASPRIRFDIVLNNLAGLAWTTGRIAMTSDGTPWRPLVHVQDICGAIAATLGAPRATVAGQIFNVGDNANNYRVREIAAAIGEAFPNCKIELGSNAGDNRSYRVSFDKIHSVLPGFRCRWTAQRGARQMRSLFEHIAMPEQTFNAAPFTRLRELQRLLDTQQIDSDFYWRPHDFS
ncbi:SDR family oxidoreductase [Vineibacter terrae]|uniref:NAD-dependent epimerase/dehydratase family protein n=1 Tax=Vineibacter terrae TaxID=2586908 RepID=UPI002E356830|nr:SDR family oxidoreductase [Vineibacter terrae]HEX2886741.1 SDR family oxidoreductase [Vineibacter terrae]